MARAKGKGDRIVFIVNPNNPKEKRIYDFLEQQYNKSDTIKSILSKLLDGKSIDMSEYCDMTCIIPPVTIENEISTTEVKQQINKDEEIKVEPKVKNVEDKVSLEIKTNIQNEWESYRI